MGLTDLFMDSCCTVKTKLAAAAAQRGVKKIRVALAGNANVGKSALFNYLTGMHQHVGNWPGKTVEKVEGTLRYFNYEIDVIDLPGIYSLSTFSVEEEVSREYIISEKPDVVVNVIDSCALERNLFFTIQLMELGAPLVVALNQTDAAKKKGIDIDEGKLSRILGVPVVKTAATTGFGVARLMRVCAEFAEKRRKPKTVKYGKGLETLIGKIEVPLRKLRMHYPERYAAIKLLEKDTIMKRTVGSKSSEVLAEIEKKAHTAEKESGETLNVTVSKERYNAANRIAAETQTISAPKEGLMDKFEELTTHRFFGYVIMLFALGAIFYSIFSFGYIASTEIGNFFNAFRPSGEGLAENILWEGLFGGLVAGITLVLPYALPFYLLLSLLEDTGYITRIAYLLDGLAHRVGFHGKAIIPLILGYGCNVPAIFGARIMEYERDRLITAFAVTLVPCTARTVIVLALIGTYLGPWWALAMYLFNIAVIALLSKIAFKTFPGEPMGLIMEMPHYKIPSASLVLKHTWWKIKSILTVVFPYYMVGGLLFAIAYIFGVFDPLNQLLAPVTEGWLGLPAFTATLLLFGAVRKELIVVLPAVLYGTGDLSTVFTASQMIVLTVIAMFYVPCLATIETLRREFGIEKAVFITVFEIVFALVLGGLVARILPFLGFA